MQETQNIYENNWQPLNKQTEELSINVTQTKGIRSYHICFQLWQKTTEKDINLQNVVFGGGGGGGGGGGQNNTFF